MTISRPPSRRPTTTLQTAMPWTLVRLPKGIVNIEFQTETYHHFSALIFETDADLEQGLYQLIGNSYIRVLVVHLGEADALERLAKMRPSPNYYVAYGTTDTMTNVYK